MSKIYEQHQKHLSEKFGIEKLQTESFKPNEKIDLNPSNGNESKHWQAHLQSIKNKYNMENLHLESSIGQRAEQSLGEVIRQKNVQNQKGYKLATAKTIYKGQAINIWYETSR